MSSNSRKNSADSGERQQDGCPAFTKLFDTAETCSGNYVPLTRDEEDILARMRELKAQVGRIKKKVQELEAAGAEQHTGEIDKKRQELEGLRKEWQDLDNKRRQAAAVRMKILGHEG